MKVVVQKFGGTCVETEENQALTAERIMEAKDRDLQPVVVVSAMGRKGQPYSTIEMVNLVTRDEQRIDPRTLDMVMSCGEIMSAAAMAHLLWSKGYETIALTGGQAGLITDSYHGAAQIIRIEPEQLLAALQRRQVVFVAGFQGIAEHHALTTLGEGGSDYTAVALAMIIHKTEQLPFGENLELAGLHIFKEVDGMLSANPNSMPDKAREEPKRITALTYDESVAMANLGAGVLQHRAAAMARKYHVPILVRNYRSPDSEGTRIPAAGKQFTVGRATAITDHENLLVFSIESDSQRLSAQLAERMDRDRLTYFKLSGDSGIVRFAVKQEKYRKVPLLLEHIFFERSLTAKLDESPWALVSLVGEGLRSKMAETNKHAREALKAAAIDVTGTLHSEISVSYLVAEEQRMNAVLKLHRRFVRGED